MLINQVVRKNLDAEVINEQIFKLGLETYNVLMLNRLGLVFLQEVVEEQLDLQDKAVKNAEMILENTMNKQAHKPEASREIQKIETAKKNLAASKKKLIAKEEINVILTEQLIIANQEAEEAETLKATVNSLVKRVDALENKPKRIKKSEQLS